MMVGGYRDSMQSSVLIQDSNVAVSFFLLPCEGGLRWGYKGFPSNPPPQGGGNYPPALMFLIRCLHQWVMGEESCWHQLEPGAMHRHHRPFLRTRNVRYAQCIPDNHVGVFDRPIGARPFR